MKLLYPLSFIYGLITFIRNKLFDFNILKQKKYDVETISVGNLSLGGTGKTPHIEYLIEKYIKQKKIAVVSRGYGRKTKGFRYVEVEDIAENAGDEPLQIKIKYNEIIVAVCEKRTVAIEKILNDFPHTELILLDDAFQHRYVKRDLNVLLTDYSKPFWNDCVLPCGSLREFVSGYKRADVIIITKCPKIINLKIPNDVLKKNILFSSIKYGTPIIFNGKLTKKVILVTGIANHKPFIDFVKKENFEIIHHFKFADHYNFNISEIEKINRKLNSIGDTMILTTEKDFMRIGNFYKNSKICIAYIPIKIEIENEPENWFKLGNRVDR
ncbi:MAG: tetraacyldisaccharide 4'-kinase [Bacteroidetes bacterium]|nr:tetraacyldisaccharide 4'-kinase [Bacteroidota bacterium]